ncbi:chromatin-remodeling complex subunit ies6 [Friedmanniomyces endolithicus]|nr:chromatin-remodeling complex subunit ies6 [Friedmanniomyces endolithicus]
MAPITTASNEETHQALLDTLDMQKVEKPFRNPNWKPPQRRNKSLKQILSEAQRAQQSIINTQQNSGATTPQAATDGEGGAAASLNPNPAQGSQDLSRLVLEKNAAAGMQNGSLAVPNTIATGLSVTYASIQAGPSTKKPKKYCDITGLPAKYTCPKTGLHYFNAEMYKVVKGLSTAQVQEYLAMRNAHTVLKKLKDQAPPEVQRGKQADQAKLAKQTKLAEQEKLAELAEQAKQAEQPELAKQAELAEQVKQAEQAKQTPQTKKSQMLAAIEAYPGLEKNVFDQKPFEERTRTQKALKKKQT